jgi:hypothetical protein
VIGVVLFILGVAVGAGAAWARLGSLIAEACEARAAAEARAWEWSRTAEGLARDLRVCETTLDALQRRLRTAEEFLRVIKGVDNET